MPSGIQVSAVKCVVFDLDNVVWRGYCHNGQNSLELHQDMIDLLRFLDDKGVLISVASKNAPADAMAAIDAFGLRELFVSPQIGWEPKSTAIRRIAEELGIRLDSIIFVDDEPSERAEVISAIQEVRAYSPDVALTLKEDTTLFPGSKTAEARKRRQFYKTDELRKKELFDKYRGDYERFLEESRIEITVIQASPQHFERIAELFSRTSRLNFSARRYSPEELSQLLAGESTRALVIRVVDRFGDYGMTGVLVLNQQHEQRRVVVSDFVLSCRVQGKFVEHSLLAWIAEVMASEGVDEIAVRFVRTEFNSHLEEVFHQLGWRQQFITDSEELWYVCQPMNWRRPDGVYHKVTPVRGPMAVEVSGLPFVRNLVIETLQSLPAGSRVLDLGAGVGDVMGETWPIDFRRYFPTGWLLRGDQRHTVGVDLVVNAEDLSCIPGNSFDAVLLLEVLEHAERFWQIIDEVERVLQPGGALVVSAPFRSPIHREPRDFYRFTSDGLRWLLSRFEIVRTAVEGPESDPIRTVIVARKPKAARINEPNR